MQCAILEKNTKISCSCFFFLFCQFAAEPAPVGYNKMKTVINVRSIQTAVRDCVCFYAHTSVSVVFIFRAFGDRRIFSCGVICIKNVQKGERLTSSLLWRHVLENKKIKKEPPALFLWKPEVQPDGGARECRAVFYLTSHSNSKLKQGHLFESLFFFF